MAQDHAAAAPEASAYPLSVAEGALRARDAEGLSAFYARGLGLAPQSDGGDGVALGAGGRTLVRLLAAPDAPAPAAGAAGLFHVAFLMPTRADLGRWLAAARAAGLAIAGASDHGVSEAVYLRDPEGNGIEVYADRPRADWPRDATGYAMDTRPMDVASVLAEGAQAGGPRPAFADGSAVGHVHLAVGDAGRAEEWLARHLALTATHRRPGAVWLGAGGYHHHVAANAWGSAGAGPRDPVAAGLDEITIAVTDPSLADRLGVGTDPTRLSDPWGTRFVLRRAA